MAWHGLDRNVHENCGHFDATVACCMGRGSQKAIKLMKMSLKLNSVCFCFSSLPRCVHVLCMEYFFLLSFACFWCFSFFNVIIFRVRFFSIDISADCWCASIFVDLFANLNLSFTSLWEPKCVVEWKHFKWFHWNEIHNRQKAINGFEYILCIYRTHMCESK